MIAGDVIRPGLDWLVQHTPRGLAAEMARARDGAAFARLAALASREDVIAQARAEALNRIAIIMAAKGGAAADIAVGDCVQLLHAASGRRAGTGRRPASGPSLFYYLLQAAGVLGSDAPASARMLAARGQPGCEELIGRYRIQSEPIRDLLVDYLRERRASMDFASLDNLARQLGLHFWADLEAHHPGISSLKLPADAAAAWKARVMTMHGPGTGEVRLSGRGTLSAVRAFYLDITEWADDDPARWGPFAERCPVSASDASHKKDRLHRKSRMDQRTRERLPLLPTLAARAETGKTAAADLLHAATAAAPGELFTAGGQTLRRAVMKTSAGSGRIWAAGPDDSKRRDLAREEHRAF